MFHTHLFLNKDTENRVEKRNGATGCGDVSEERGPGAEFVHQISDTSTLHFSISVPILLFVDIK